MKSTPLVVLALVLQPAAVGGQELDRRCLKAVETVCGKKRLQVCFEADAAWAKVPERCVGDVQTLIENEREALSERRAGSRR